jgi:hypothetical protein
MKELLKTKDELVNKLARLEVVSQSHSEEDRGLQR